VHVLRTWWDSWATPLGALITANGWCGQRHQAFRFQVVQFHEFVLSSMANQNPPTCALQSHKSHVGSTFGHSLGVYMYLLLSSLTTMICNVLPVCCYSPVSCPPTPRSALLADVLMTALVHCLHTYETCSAIKVCWVGGSAIEVLLWPTVVTLAYPSFFWF
jgi:hypothetical protein